MNEKKSIFTVGTVKCGLFCGSLLAGFGTLFFLLGFWATVLVCVLFVLGFFMGSVTNKFDKIKNSTKNLFKNEQ